MITVIVSQIWDITWFKNPTLLDKTSILILPESCDKDLAILMTELKPHLVTLWDNSRVFSTEPAASCVQFDNPHNSQDLQLPHLQGLESCLEGNAVARVDYCQAWHNT